VELCDTTFHRHVEHSAKLEASLQEKSAKLAGVLREVGDQAKALAELRNELQQRTNEATEAKQQLAQREAELEETRVQLSQQGGARTRPNSARRISHTPSNSQRQGRLPHRIRDGETGRGIPAVTMLEPQKSLVYSRESA